MASNTTSSTAADLTAINILTYVFLAVVTFGIGAGVQLSSLRTVAKKYKAAVALGLSAQLLVVPAVARFVSIALDMDDMDAFGIILLGCCPGGAVSNAFAYWANAELALSISMTAISNGLAFGTLPLLLFLWTRGLGTVSYRIPFLEIFGSLMLVLLPAAVGVHVRRVSPRRWGPRAERLGAVGGAVLILSSIFAGVAQNSNTLSDATLLPLKNALAVSVVAPIGMLFALLALRLLRCFVPVPLPVAATVVLETGVQNTVLALAIANLATAGPQFSKAESLRLQLLTITWGLVVSAEALVATAIFRHLQARASRTPSPPSAAPSGVLT